MFLQVNDEFNRSGDVKTIHSELNRYFAVDEPQVFFQKSFDVIACLTILGAAVEWLGLRDAVKVYFTTLAKHAGDATWNKLASLKQSKEVKPLVDVASTLTNAEKGFDGKVNIIIGINLPDDVFGTVFNIQSTDVEGVLHELAFFIVHVEELSAVMQREIEEGRVPLGAAIVNIQDDGSLLVRWRGRNDSKKHTLRIPFHASHS